ncbi:hypothetical protein AB0X56_04490 [Weissella paramesenteroides]|uniref:hypothetical protein n=1 Tax=Weissella paramesenteroides TaxID=1249 RepID=UPI003F2027E4
MWLLTSIFDQRLTEISVIVGILGAISALPIFKSIGNWSQRRRKHKADRLTEAIAKATRPLIESYHREHQEIMDKLADQDETSISLLHDRVYIDGQKMLDKGETSIDEIDNFIHLYQRYRKLGGNGTGEAMNRRVMDLPLKHETNTLVQEADRIHKEREEK